MKTCDICLSECHPTELKSIYATRDIKEICDECCLLVNKHERKVWEFRQRMDSELSKQANTWLKNFMEKLKLSKASS